MKKRKLVLALMLSLMMLVSMIPAVSFADGAGIRTEGGELSAGTYTLSGDVDLTNNLTIPAGEKVTIDLNGHTLKGNGSGSVIVVNGELTIKDSGSEGKITGGNATSSKGGGILVKTGGNLHLLSGAITDNQAGYGGGVCVEAQGSFIMDGGEISNNKALNTKNSGGGGIAIEKDDSAAGSVTISSGKISGNSSRIQGGGIFSNGTLVMNGGEISNNTAPAGGGVMSNSNSFTMNAGSVINNTADYTENIANGGTFNNALGGGIKVANSKFYFYGGKVSGNKVVAVDSKVNMCDGGGIHLRDSAEMHVKGAPVVENNSNQQASGTPYADNIYMQHSNVVLIFDGDLSEDAKLAVRKSGNVGQITDCGDYTFKEGTITADDPETRFVEREGDLYFGTSVAEEKAVAYTYVNGKKFYYASLEDAVADLASGSATLYILKNVELPQKLTISNRADLTLSPEEGESIVITGGDSVSTSFFSIPQGAKLTVQGDITFDGESKNVKAFDVQGSLTIGSDDEKDKNPVIQNFASQNNGGAISVKNGTFTLNNGKISENKTGASNKVGGAIYVDSGVMNLKGGVVQNNASTSYGGGICLNNSSLNMSGGRIENNTAGNGTGGGLHAYAKSVVNITGGTVKDNNATNGQISLNASSAMLVDGQIGDVKTLSGAYCFYTNGGVFENSATMTALPEPSKKAWKFAGWYENENCTGDKVTTLQAGKTYYADWTAKEEQNMFYKPESVTKHLGAEAFTNELTKTDVHGDLTYKSSDEKVATVDAATGEVTIVGAGTATITATAAETGDYKEASASYELTVTNHEFKDSWESDADNHWHSCAVEGCTVKSDEAAHDFEWIVDKNATATEKGTKHEECTVCHFQKDPVEIPAKGTSGGDQNANGSGTNADTSADGTKTGDAMPIGLLAVLMMAAAAGIAFCGRKLYKSR